MIQSLTPVAYPILYTFRRCPYAIRARMALAYAKIQVEMHEVALKDKPQEMLQASPKGTVPVLLLENGQVIDESMEIMFWALKQSDPDGWLAPESTDLIRANDQHFKPILDKYKYSSPTEEPKLSYYREQAQEYLNQLNSLVINKPYLLSNHLSYIDVALFPFIRQFYMVDKEWFEHGEYQALHNWLQSFLNSELFLKVMQKL